ncbi:ectoine synthase [Virgibacillus ainsalahensis]
MIVKYLDEIEGTKDETADGNWKSRRFILNKDGVGFSMNDTVIAAGTENYFWYKNHIEAVYVIEGEGQIEEVENGKMHDLRPGTLYLLNDHDKHKVHAKTQLRMVCVFNPPLVGTETHNEEGYYPLLTE